jgi:hypothetical protein
MAARATGTFEVKITPLTPDGIGGDKSMGRMSIDKRFQGDLEGVSKGEMLTAGTDVKGSGVYVAVEKVEGSLAGRTGTFLLRHVGTMTRGVPELSIAVVPDSGASDLKGITGTMNIIIEQGKHSYEFDYSLEP